MWCEVDVSAILEPLLDPTSSSTISVLVANLIFSCYVRGMISIGRY